MSSSEIVVRRSDPHLVTAYLAGEYERTVMDLRTWSCSAQLKEQLADALELLTGVNGTWKTAKYALGSLAKIKRFTRWCVDNEIAGMEQLTLDKWNTYLLSVSATKGNNSTKREQIATVRQVLLQFPERLPEDLPKHLIRRLPKRDSVEVQPYTKEVFDVIQKAAASVVNEEYQRIKSNRDLLSRRDSDQLSPQEKLRADALVEVATKGAPMSDATRIALGIELADKRGSGVKQARPLLFVSYEGIVAVLVLIACLEGANYTTINERKVPSAAPGLGVSEDIWSVEDEKRRRQGRPFEVHAVPENTRRPMAKIIEMTATGRDFLRSRGLPGADRLIVYWPGASNNLDSVPMVGLRLVHLKSERLQWWPLKGEPISFNRIRKTVRVLIDRTPQGHSRSTWSTIYVGASEAERERLLTEAVEVGIWAYISNAQQHLKMRFQRNAQPSDQDTPLGGCIDWERHPVTGEPCGDDFLLCLQCTNSFATPKHLPRLIELRNQLEAIASTDGPDWTDFRAIALGCLVALLDDRSLISDKEYVDAARSITDEDRNEITLMLNGRYSA